MKITAWMSLDELAREMGTGDMIAAGFMSGLLTPFTGMDTRDLDEEDWEWMKDEAYDKARDERVSEWLAGGPGR